MITKFWLKNTFAPFSLNSKYEIERDKKLVINPFVYVNTFLTFVSSK